MEQLPKKNKDVLGKLIKSTPLEKPSPDFTLNVMNKLGIQYSVESVKASPIISAKGWIFIGILISTIIGMVFLEPSNSQSSITGTIINSAESVIGPLFKSSFMMYLAILSFSVFLLTGADALFRRSRYDMVEA